MLAHEQREGQEPGALAHEGQCGGGGNAEPEEPAQQPEHAAGAIGEHAERRGQDGGDDEGERGGEAEAARGGGGVEPLRRHAAIVDGEDGRDDDGEEGGVRPVVHGPRDELGTVKAESAEQRAGAARAGRGGRHGRKE
jgi:hypothetical protein